MDGRSELRLAVVCYGGVSLCIYMHGITKELHHLVRASQLSADDAGGLTGAEAVYRDVLDELQADSPDGVRKKVVVDIVTGTSAGGINGVFLAKAIARNRGQDRLRDLWFEEGDIKKLMRGVGPLELRLLEQLPQLVSRPPLHGDNMSRSLYDALKGMDDENPLPASVETLMPADQLLQLFVTMTDFRGYDRQALIADPPVVHDLRHRHCFEFRRGDGRDDFAPDGNMSLAFAARATSSFPGAFPPVSVRDFQGYFDDYDEPPGQVSDHFFRVYDLCGAPHENTYFVDGGVLDNRPFGYAITAIRARPAESEVERKLLYLEPDPDPPPAPADEGDESERRLHPIQTVMGALAGIPRQEPILNDLLEVATLNERVRRLRDIIVLHFDEISRAVTEETGGALLTGEAPDDDTLAGWQGQLNDRAQSNRPAYGVYLRAKITDVVDRMADLFCAHCDYPDESNHAFFVRRVVPAWAHTLGLFEFAKDGAPLPPQLRFLEQFDVDYGVRRLKFVIAGLNWYYPRIGEDGYPTRKQLDELKSRLWNAVVQLENAFTEPLPDELCRTLLQCFPEDELSRLIPLKGFDPDDYVATKKRPLAEFKEGFAREIAARLDGSGAALVRDVRRLSSDWHRDRQWELLVRYLGFPMWDVLLYPLQRVSDAGERDSVDVMRMSPGDSELLPVPAGGKLKGTGLGHFKAFFALEYRQNDYLWGRLDAAERLVGIVLGGPRHPLFRSACRRAFLAILDEEQPTLGTDEVQALIRALRDSAERLDAAGQADVGGRPRVASD